MDKYLEKMVLVPLERWEQLIRNEKEKRENIDGDMNEKETLFPVVENTEGEKDIKVNDQDSHISPPGIPSTGMDDMTDGFNENYDQPINKKRKKMKKTLSSFHWKNLP